MATTVPSCAVAGEAVAVGPTTLKLAVAVNVFCGPLPSYGVVFASTTVMACGPGARLFGRVTVPLGTPPGVRAPVPRLRLAGEIDTLAALRGVVPSSRMV